MGSLLEMLVAAWGKLMASSARHIVTCYWRLAICLLACLLLRLALLACLLLEADNAARGGGDSWASSTWRDSWDASAWSGHGGGESSGSWSGHGGGESGHGQDPVVASPVVHGQDPSLNTKRLEIVSERFD